MFKKVIAVTLNGKIPKERKLTLNLSPAVVAYIDEYAESSFAGVRVKFNAGGEVLIKDSYEDLTKDLIASENKPVIVRQKRYGSQKKPARKAASSSSE